MNISKLTIKRWNNQDCSKHAKRYWPNRQIFSSTDSHPILNQNNSNIGRHPKAMHSRTSQ